MVIRIHKRKKDRQHDGQKDKQRSTKHVGGIIFCLRCLCLFGYSGFQHILCCVFALFVCVLCTLYCQFLWIVHFCLALRYSLTFIKEVLLIDILFQISQITLDTINIYILVPVIMQQEKIYWDYSDNSLFHQ